MPLKRTPPKSPNVATLDVHPLQTHSQSDPSLSVTNNPETIITKTMQRVKRKRDRSADQSELDDFKNTIMDILKELQSTVSEIKEQNVKLQESVDFTAHKYDEILTKMKQMEEARREDKAYIISLENKIDKLEQQSRATSVEIRNIPKRSGETKQDLLHTLNNIFKVIKLPPQETDVKDIFRNHKKTSTPTMIVEFGTVKNKESLLRHIKKFNKENCNNKLNTEHLSIQGPKLPIYCSENLSSKTKRLFFLARELASQEKYKFCWTTHGKVYLRKDEGSPLCRIESEGDISKLRVQK
ncbi:PREDICTED: uncharacterized protein LOC106127872 [Papilio xuthus]|uniref:Uncharacterized protein LOC106118861 n=1 Tax=Papilio xuthus TaxID=66420 RepID=A0AAJ6ZY80_PAPXU|nr:PREDICTED: uncharacterized protein LOC106118861 [Papilio xuthus]XP_013181614.1 PREDICTED: uncharacterized protein LOC106127872 [Papilio xuthus]